MKEAVLVKGDRAKKIAASNAPFIIHGYKSKIDQISRVNLGKFIENPEPVVYFAVKEDSYCKYCYYFFYHQKDVSHDHDWEGCLIINGDTTETVVTRSHWDLLCYQSGINHSKSEKDIWIKIAAGNHSVKLASTKDFNLTKFTKYSNKRYSDMAKYELIDLGNTKIEKWLKDIYEQGKLGKSVRLHYKWWDKNVYNWMGKNHHRYSKWNEGKLYDREKVFYGHPALFLRVYKSLGKIK